MTKRKKPPITKAKQEWASRFQYNGIMRGESLSPREVLMAKYDAKLSALVKQMTAQTRRELERFFKKDDVAASFFAQDASISSDARILTNAINKKFNHVFARSSKQLAERMVENANKESGAAVQRSIERLSGGMQIKTSAISAKQKEVMKAAVSENVSLIRSISVEYLDKVQEAVMRSIVSGRGLQDLVPFLERQEGITLRRARTIARDQTKKTYSALNRNRVTENGIQEFEWIHTGGGREHRQLHKDYNGVIFRYDKPPIIDERTGARGYPGDAINCYCIQRPIIRFDHGEAE